jgi:predicted ester cyclase
MVAEGDKVVSFITMTGTHKGDYMGVTGTDKIFKIQVIDIIKVVNGQMTEHWGVGDYMTMMEQLGMGAQ